MEDLSSVVNLRLLDGVAVAVNEELYLVCLPELFEEVELADEAEDGGVSVGCRVVYSNCWGLCVLSRLGFSFGMCGSCLTGVVVVAAGDVLESFVSSKGFCSGW